MALIIGITGGIGSGKSTVCKIFKILGAPVFEADIIAKDLLENNEIKHELKKLFGNNILNSKGEVDRSRLADIVFNDDIKLEKLNSIIHPAVRDKFMIWADKMKSYHYIIIEAAILFESGFNKLTDYTILVTAPEHMRIERVSRRDGVPEDNVRARIRNQLPEEGKKLLADFIIINDNSDLIIPQIIKIDNSLKHHGKIW
jgi:dephospho-CoA kinase